MVLILILYLLFDLKFVLFGFETVVCTCFELKKRSERRGEIRFFKTRHNNPENSFDRESLQTFIKMGSRVYDYYSVYYLI